MEQTLIQLIDEASKIRQELIESGGELSAALEDLIETNKLALCDKIDRCVYVMTALEADADLMNKHQKEFQAAKKAFENSAQRLKSYLKFCLQTIKETTVSGNKYQVSISNSKPSLIINNEGDIPARYKTQVISYEINKDLLRADLEGVGDTGSYFGEEFRAALETKNKQISF